MSMDTGAQAKARNRILEAAAGLITEGGRQAATTRAVAIAAGVQAPTIYRIFGDKDGLLIATAEYQLDRYVREKGDMPPLDDPIEDLKTGWDRHVAFCLANPGLFPILSSGPLSSVVSAPARAGMEVLRRRVRRIAEAGRLTTTEERAVAAIHASGTGLISTLLAQSEDQRDGGLSAFTRDMVIGAITNDSAIGGAKGDRSAQAAASELRSSLGAIPMLTAGERHLLGELLQRIAIADV